MDTMKQSSALRRVEQSLKQSYRHFFDLETTLPTMPQRQLQYFIERAHAQHLLIAVQMRDQHVAVGFINHQVHPGIFIMRAENSHVDQIIRLDQCQYIKRCDSKY